MKLPSTLFARWLFGFFVLLGSTAASQTPVFFNEIHYDNAGTDVGEAIEIAGPAGTDLTGWYISLYNGSNGLSYGTASLSGAIPNTGNGFGVVVINYPVNGLQNGDPDGFALVNASNQVVQFLSHEGTFTALNGPANGLTSMNIGVAETSLTPIGFSLQLTGTGKNYEDFTWATEAANTFGAFNNSQVFSSGPISPKINEFVASHTSTDTNEYVEIFGSANADYSAYSVLAIEGDFATTATGLIDAVLPIGTTNAQGFWVSSFLTNALENGSITLLLVKDFTGTSGQDLDTNDDGVLDATPWSELADGVAVNDGGATDRTYAVTLGVAYDGLSFAPGGASRIPDGKDTDVVADWVRNDFDLAGITGFAGTPVAGEALNTPGAANQTVPVAPPVLTKPVINEFVASHTGADVNEFVEIYGAPNGDYSAYKILQIEGDAGTPIGNVDQIISVGTTSADSIWVSSFINSLVENGTMTLLLVKDFTGTLNQDLDTNDDGMLDVTPWSELADGVAVNDGGAGDQTYAVTLGVAYDGLSFAPGGASRIPNGKDTDTATDWVRNDFDLAGITGFAGTPVFGEAFNTPGADNEIVPAPVVTLKTIAEARALAVGQVVTIQGILTATNQFGGPAYIQDTTAGIAIFDAQIHVGTTYQIGDELKITGTRSDFNQLKQLGTVTEIVKISSGNVVTPKVITIGQMLDFEGQLVTVQGASFPQPGSILWGNTNFNVTTASGNGDVRIDADVVSLVGKTQPSACDVTGIAGNFRGVGQLLPRFLADLPCAGDFVPPTPGGDKANTLDVVTWNIEWFGNTGNGPSPESTQKDSAKQVIVELDADVYAFQEIADENLLQQLADELPNYELVVQTAFVSQPPNQTGVSQKLAFLYKTSTVAPVYSQGLLASIHPLYNGGDASALVGYPDPDPTRFYASGRLPFLFVADVTINGETERIHFINLHARANNSSNPQGTYDMRKYDVEILKDSLDTYFPNANIVMLGDFNDDVDVTVANIPSTVTSYEAYVADTANYKILTATLSAAGFRSFVTSDNVIDHIMVSNELVDNHVVGSEIVHYEVYDADYLNTTSDHMPVSVAMTLREPRGTVTVKKEANPAAIAPTFSFSGDFGDFTLVDGESVTFLELREGAYQLAEVLPANWSLTNVTIEGDTDGGSATVGAEALIDLDGGENIVVTYYNTLAANAITAFTLINPNNDQDVMVLEEGASIMLEDYVAAQGTDFFAIRADTFGSPASVVLSISGPIAFSRVENVAPFALFGDQPINNYLGRKLIPGEYVLTATPYSQTKATGAAGLPLTVRFRVVSGQRVERLVLINAVTDQDIAVMAPNMTIDLDAFEVGTTFNVRAETQPGVVGSVRMNLDGPIKVSRIENAAPYALFGDSNGDYNGVSLPVGNYTISATPFQQGAAKGTVGESLSMAFQVVRGGGASRLAAGSLEEQLRTQGMLVYPNPVRGKATIELGELGGELSLFNLAGQLVFSTRVEGNQSLTLDAAKYQKGMYLIKLVTSRQQFVQKLVID